MITQFRASDAIFGCCLFYSRPAFWFTGNIVFTASHTQDQLDAVDADEGTIIFTVNSSRSIARAIQDRRLMNRLEELPPSAMEMQRLVIPGVINDTFGSLEFLSNCPTINLEWSHYRYGQP